MIRRTLAGLAIAVTLAGGAGAQPKPAPPSAAPDYGALLVKDATALHDAMMGSHPGPVDPENPAFRKRLDEGLQLALRRARSTHSYGGYWWAMREYIAGFDDGHVGVSTTKAAPSLNAAWPGFLTRFDGDRQIVATRLDEASAPPLGAELLSCDGRAADRLAAENVGHFRGRWFLASQRAQHGARLFLDADNPWIRRPAVCVFKVDGNARNYRLAWRPMSDDEVGRRLADASAAFRAPFEVRPFGNGGLWISAGSFDGQPDSDAYKALTAVMDSLKADPARLRDARVIVFDVRGNGGGSSEWPVNFAALVWGEPWVQAHLETAAQVDWRVSDANIAELDGYDQALRRQEHPDPVALGWVDKMLSGLKAAKAKGQALWREPDDGGPPPAPPANLKPQSGARVYILTDPACASACLDGVDVWKASGAIQVGRETSADTNYMEVRDQDLPSGLANISIPMKVYRGRTRGANEPQKPAFVFPGRMDDTPALEGWIEDLAGK